MSVLRFAARVFATRGLLWLVWAGPRPSASLLPAGEPPGVVVEVTVEGLWPCRRIPGRACRRGAQQVAVVRDEDHAGSVSCRARVRAWRISRSRWLVGSSSSSRLGVARSAGPGRGATSRRRKSGPQGEVAIRESRSRRGNRGRSCSRALPMSRSRRIMCQRGFVRAQLFQLVLGEVADGFSPLPSSRSPAESGLNSPASSLISVDLPAPLRPSSAMRSPGAQVLESVRGWLFP
jgi:hypothetical protein